jgi:hypothetical protein
MKSNQLFGMKISHIIRLMLASWIMTHASAQQPAPPPPPDTSSGPAITPGNIDLSKIPIPAADAEFERGQMTEEERKGPTLQIHVIPVGYVAPPIIYLDAAGMPREKYRHPLEYPPVIYHIKTQKGTVRTHAAQNQIGPAWIVPKLPTLTFSYQMPADPNGNPDPEPQKGPKLVTITEFPVPATATHLGIIVWKDPAEKLWSRPQCKVIDLSPSQTPQHQAIVVNVSHSPLSLERGDQAYLIKKDYIGKAALPMNQQNQLMMVVNAPLDQKAEPLIQTAFDVHPDQRAFLLSWSVPKDAARPHGVAITAVAKSLYEETQGTAEH